MHDYIFLLNEWIIHWHLRERNKTIFNHWPLEMNHQSRDCRTLSACCLNDCLSAFSVDYPVSSGQPFCCTLPFSAGQQQPPFRVLLRTSLQGLLNTDFYARFPNVNPIRRAGGELDIDIRVNRIPGFACRGTFWEQKVFGDSLNTHFYSRIFR